MKVAVQQEDLQLLARTLQEQLLARVRSDQVFQVKCAINDGGLMILTQHPPDVTVDTENIFQLLEEALQSWPCYWEQPVQCFLRVAGEKRPYAQRLLTWSEQAHQQREEEHEINRSQAARFVPDNQGFFPPSSASSSRIYHQEEEDKGGEDSLQSGLDLADGYISETGSVYGSYSEPETEAEEAFDPLAGSPDLLSSKSARPIKPILLGAGFVGIILLGGGYLVTRPCVLSECPELQIAKQLKTDSRQLIHRAKSSKELVVVQQQLDAASLSLTKIPSWSPRHQEIEELKTGLSAQSEKINQVVKALQAASLAMAKTQTPAKSLEELHNRQNLWRQAIAPLEAINTNSDVYGLVQPKLAEYHAQLQNVNQQLLTEKKWLIKIAAAKAVASAATKQEATAKSLNDWQKVQSTWQVVINALNVIPQTSSGYQQAQDLLAEYKPKLVAARDRATQEQLTFKTYQQALGTANQARLAQKNNQWQVAVVRWGQAIQAAKQISRDSFYYAQAQSLIEPYSASLKQAQEKLKVISDLQKTQADLKKTCSGEIQICKFTVDNRAIIVQLTPDYDQKRQNTSIDPNAQDPNTISIQRHWQNLQDALAIISDNARLSLLVYDSQGKPAYTRSRVE